MSKTTIKSIGGRVLFESDKGTIAGAVIEAMTSGADLYRADLYRADLSGATGFNKYLVSPLYGMLDQVGKIRAYKLVNESGQGPQYGGITYAKNETVEVKKACTDENEQCAAGINLATLDWCMREWRKGFRILVAEFTRKDIAAIPVGTDGKFRVFRCKIVGEKDLSEIGLIENNTEAGKCK